MAYVERIRCDGCQREVPAPLGRARMAAPPGWFSVEGEWDAAEECWARYHLCSADCILAWANTLRLTSRFDLELARSMS